MRLIVLASLGLFGCVTIPDVAKMECLENLVRFRVAGKLVTAMDDNGNGVGCKIKTEVKK